MPEPVEPVLFLGVELVQRLDIQPNRIRLIGGPNGGVATSTAIPEFTQEAFMGLRREFLQNQACDPDRAELGSALYEGAMAAVMRLAREARTANTLRDLAELAPRPTISFGDVANGRTMMTTPIPEPVPTDPRLHEDGGCEFREEENEDEDGVYIVERSPESPRGPLSSMGQLNFTIKAGVREGMDEEGEDGHFASVCLQCGGSSVFFTEKLPEDYTQDMRVAAMKRMRLALFKWTQRRLRSEFEREKNGFPEVWDRRFAFREVNPPVAEALQAVSPPSSLTMEALREARDLLLSEPSRELDGRDIGTPSPESIIFPNGLEPSLGSLNLPSEIGIDWPNLNVNALRETLLDAMGLPVQVGGVDVLTTVASTANATAESVAEALGDGERELVEGGQDRHEPTEGLAALQDRVPVSAHADQDAAL